MHRQIGLIILMSKLGSSIHPSSMNNSIAFCGADVDGECSVIYRPSLFGNLQVLINVLINAPRLLKANSESQPVKLSEPLLPWFDLRINCSTHVPTHRSNWLAREYKAMSPLDHFEVSSQGHLHIKLSLFFTLYLLLTLQHRQDSSVTQLQAKPWEAIPLRIRFRAAAKPSPTPFYVKTGSYR